jgi:hypothetical protein
MAEAEAWQATRDWLMYQFNTLEAIERTGGRTADFGRH